jgi:hypothetical protein
MVADGDDDGGEGGAGKKLRNLFPARPAQFVYEKTGLTEQFARRLFTVFLGLSILARRFSFGSSAF